MSTLTKIALAAFAGLLLGGGALALGQNSADDGLTTTNQTTTVEKPGDVSGPCDEAEHANDPRCDGPQRPEDGRRDDDNNDDAGDISGPCDEAEHANDPRCTGAGDDREDNSGPGSANSGHGDADDDDGDHEDNSGPGNSHEDNSGPGNSHDDGDEDDDSGSGHSGSESSGSGSSGSGHSGGSDDD